MIFCPAKRPHVYHTISKHFCTVSVQFQVRTVRTVRTSNCSDSELHRCLTFSFSFDQIIFYIFVCVPLGTLSVLHCLMSRNCLALRVLIKLYCFCWFNNVWLPDLTLTFVGTDSKRTGKRLERERAKPLHSKCLVLDDALMGRILSLYLQAFYARTIRRFLFDALRTFPAFSFCFRAVTV